MKNLALIALLAISCKVETTPATDGNDTCTAVLVPDTAPDSIQKTQYPDSGCVVSADTIK